MNHIGYSRFDEPEIFEVEQEYVHVDELHDMKQKMKSILEIVYGDKDVEDLEYELEGLASYFDLKLPARAFTLARK